VRVLVRTARRIRGKLKGELKLREYESYSFRDGVSNRLTQFGPKGSQIEGFDTNNADSRNRTLFEFSNEF
jgi:hypothetical protein